MQKNKVILAPHIDDELIGCYSLFKSNQVKKVIYYFDLTNERKQEALNLSKMLGVDISFNGFDEKLDPSDVLVVPNIKDAHPHHKAVNLFSKTLPNNRLYYSIDMNVDFDVLSPVNSGDKKILLSQLYPSQHALFLNEKYHLFESIKQDDSFKKIWVTFQKKGIHNFKGVSLRQDSQDIFYLEHPHRHLFKFKVVIEVFHDDREIEFHQFLNWLEGLYDSSILSLQSKSCEMISDDLYFLIMRKYPGRYIKIEVSEDGECGSEIEYAR